MNLSASILSLIKELLGFDKQDKVQEALKSCPPELVEQYCSSTYQTLFWSLVGAITLYIIYKLVLSLFKTLKLKLSVKKD